MRNEDDCSAKILKRCLELFECLAGSVGSLPLTSRIVVTRAARPVVAWLLIGVGLALALVVVFFLILYA